MKSEELKQKLHKYIDKATEEELITILSFVEEEPENYIIANKYNQWEDEEFVKEMDSRVKEFESGKVKAIPMEEVHSNALEKLKDKKNGK